MLFYDFPLTKKQFEEIKEQVGINPIMVFNRGAYLCDDWGRPINEKYSILVEWARKRLDGGRIITACTTKSFRLDGKLFFSADKIHANTLVYAVLNENQRVSYSMGTLDSARQIVEYACADVFDYEKRLIELEHKDDIIELQKYHISLLKAVGKEVARDVREVMSEGAVKSIQRMQPQISQQPLVIKQKKSEDDL